MKHFTHRLFSIGVVAAMAVSAYAETRSAAVPDINKPYPAKKVDGAYYSGKLPLRDSVVQNLFPGADAENPSPLDVNVILPDVGSVTLLLTPVSIRTANYTLRLQQPDGSFKNADPGPEHTYTGRVLEWPGAQVAASFDRVQVMAMIHLPNGATYWVQPLWDLVGNACPSLHVAYRGSDTLCSGGCSQTTIDSHTDVSGDDSPMPHGGCGTDEVPCIADLAIDVDFEYFQARGSSTFNVQDRVSAIINVVNHQFQRDVQLTHRIATITIRTAEPDPYTAAGATDLLNQVKAEWVANGGGVPRALTQLFTGRDLTGSDTGAAFDASVCDNDFAYSVVQSDFSPLFSCVTDNSAHFLGHNWGASHCTCPASTMNATLSCANTFNGAGSTSVAEINGFLESATCLTSEVIVPPNDRCDQATLVTASGSNGGNNFGASNDGGVTTGAVSCGTPGGGVRDIFWTFTPAASGPITVSTCGTSFDTILSVHTGCPATPTNMVTCNDDCGFFPGSPCPFTIQSCFSFNGTVGTTYYARVAGFAASNVGPITFNVTLPAGPLCAGDLDCDNDRDVNDIAPFVLALIDPAGYAAAHPACDINRANLNADANINGRDIAAFVALLTGGPCP